MKDFHYYLCRRLGGGMEITMKKIFIISIIDGIMRAIIIWGTLGLLYSEFIIISMEGTLIAVMVGIVLSCFSMVYTFHASKDKLIIRFLISILVNILVLGVLFINVRFPLQLRELVPGDGVMIPLYLFGFTIITVVLRGSLLVVYFLGQCFKWWIPDKNYPQTGKHNKIDSTHKL